MDPVPAEDVDELRPVSEPKGVSGREEGELAPSPSESVDPDGMGIKMVRGVEDEEAEDACAEE